MSVQPGNHGGGYDPSLTLDEQIASVTAAIAAAREGTHQIQSLRQRLADLNSKKQEHTDTVARANAEYTAERAHNPNGLVPFRV